MSSDALRRCLALRDLTDPAAGAHAMQLLLGAIVEALKRRWGCAVVWHRAHPVVRTRDNYDALGYPPDGAARDARYTRYVAEGSVLRTQTSAMVPPLLALLAAVEPRDVVLVCPGLVYRRDQIDRHHVGEPHQVDLWRVTRGAMTATDLEAMIGAVVEAGLPDRDWRSVDAEHPYTQRGRQIDVRDGDAWIEVGECGLADPDLLARAGMPAGVTGLAMGLGLDRLLMLRKGIEDIRLLRADDPRVRAQMLDLAPYRPVSRMPPVRRDLSIACALERTIEELGDRAREALGDDAEWIEAIEIRDETTELPSRARGRIGMREGQKNVLLRVTIRHPTRTLVDAEANRLRDRIYAAVHEGTAHQWASEP
ncbi:MAG: hypothetical protein R3B82_25390 [Sandaracinaceae bacterium]